MIYIISEILATACDFIFLAWFIPKFNHVKYNEIRWKWLVPLSLFVWQLIADRYLPMFSGMSTVMVIVGIITFSFVISPKKYWRALLGAITYIIVLMLFSSILYMLMSVCVSDPSVLDYGVQSYERIALLLISKLIEFAVIKLILRVFNNEDTLGFKNSILLFLCSVMTAVTLIFVIDYASQTKADGTQISILVIIFTLLLSSVALYFLVYQVEKLLKHKYEVKLLKEKMEFDRRRYEESEAVWENIRKVRHDMKNHFSVIAGYSKNNDCKAVNSYIDSILPSVENMGNFIQSENSVLDYLINSKLSVLKNTEVVVSGIVDSFKDIEDIDLACVIGNVLDNAVEAQEHVQGTKRIELSFTTVNDTRMIVCKNTVAKSVLESNKELNSTKSNPEDHGLGHKIVQSVLAKYEGWADYFEIDDMFGVQIMIPLPKERRQADS